MSFATDWDVDQYRDEHDPPEHWLLTRAFIEQHKHTYPEDRLVCLARCLANMELLGCRYPDETMTLVREMSSGIVHEYWQRQKSKIQRTFVKASDAAEAKVTRKRPNYGNMDSGCTKAPKLLDSAQYQGNSSAFILVDYNPAQETSPICLLMCSSGFCKVPATFSFEVSDSGTCCSCEVGGDVISQVTAENRTSAKLQAAQAALEDLSRRCYTIRLKVRVVSDEEVLREDLTPNSEKPESRVGSSSVGGRLLAMMGWEGGGLGKNEQGITEPVRLSDVSGRAGLGSVQKGVTREFKDNVQNRLRGYGSRFQERDLSFSSEFSNEERKEIHQIARRFNLKSRSYGNEPNRVLVVSHKFNPYHLLRYLIATGGETEKYVLVPPKDNSKCL